MKQKIILLFFALIFSINAFSQKQEEGHQNAADKIINSNKKLTIGGYGQIDFNQPFSKDESFNGNLDVHRLVLLFGYRFNDKLSFVTELEFEHVKEVYVEQAFINYSFNNYLNLRGGLMLVPMGIINEKHEPTTFHGVERPLIDKYISPTTWREIGFGLTGSVPEVSLKYQFYVMNGFASYNKGTALLTGKNGLRKARQKGAESFMSSPTFSGRVEYYGILGLNLGLSAYLGKTQSTLYNGISKDDKNAEAVADSSVVGVSMIGFDARYNRKGFEFRGQFYFVANKNTFEYNTFTTNENGANDFGKSLYGYYAELSYNLFHTSDNINTQLMPFVRYSNYDTQLSIADGLVKNNSYQNTVITTGLSWKIHQGVVLKSDVQFIKNELSGEYSNTFNAGIGLWF
jgi:hypothetical protein